MAIKSGNSLRKGMNSAEMKSIVLDVLMLYQCVSE